MANARSSALVKQLLAYASRHLDKRVGWKGHPTPIIGAMVLELLRASARRSFRGKSGSLQEMMQELVFSKFSKAVTSDSIGDLVGAYDIRRDRFSMVDGRPLGDFLAYLTRNYSPRECLRRLRDSSLLPAEPALEPLPEMVLFRRIHADLNGVICREPEETTGGHIPNSGDETFVISTGLLADSLGLWYASTSISEVTEGVARGTALKLTGAETILNHMSRNPDDTRQLPPLAAICAITLVERDEHTPTEEVEADLKAMVALAAAAFAPGLFTAASAVASVAYQIYTHLDGNDVLGTTAFRFDDILDGANRNQTASASISGSHYRNDYEYDVYLHFWTEDALGPRPTLRILGDLGIWVDGLIGNGSYTIEYPGPVSNIEWSVTAGLGDIIGAPRILIQGRRQTTVRFRGWGTYELAVKARDEADGRQISAQRTVHVRSRSADL